jgi:hypothetical protein
LFIRPPDFRHGNDAGLRKGRQTGWPLLFKSRTRDATLADGRASCKLNGLIQVDANNIVSFKFVRDGAVTDAGNHGGHAFALLHEIFRADGVIETLTESDFTELGTTTGYGSGHSNSQ